MSTIIEFINIFKSPATEDLFTNCACYWFAKILYERFPNSHVVYDPHQVHFATKINGSIYDINGLVEDDTEYIDWNYYASHFDDASMIIKNCINLERR